MIGGILNQHWQPEQQVERHTRHLLEAVAAKRWERVEQLIASDYSDRWGFTQQTAVETSEQIFQTFVRLSFDIQSLEVSLDSFEQGKATVLFGIDGTPTSPYASATQTEVNALTDPFDFTWQKQSWKPFDWQLIGFDNRSLELDPALLVPLP